MKNLFMFYRQQPWDGDGDTATGGNGQDAEAADMGDCGANCGSDAD